jgi:peptidoglycan/LPS O-acetylase OafA/YrhL
MRNLNIYNLFNISNVKRISFRNDINGLRAIAVLAVVFYHANFSFFKGGWLGVDIFFVISGYLISNIIISDLNQSRFSFKTFYLRRVKRILPALFFTITLSIPFAFWLLTPKAMNEYLDSMIASLFFYANYYFMNLEFYIAESTKVMPFLHTWSLAIEEQYYILFPVFAYFIFKNLNKYFTSVIISLFFMSIFITILSEEVNKFYQLQFRLWELLLGVLVMIISSNIKIHHLEKIGLPLMLIPIFYFNDTDINQIEPKLIALTGVALIIFSNTNETYLSKILNFKILSLIGLSSYSIYLLHQPLFAFIRIFNSDVQPVISFDNLDYYISFQTKIIVIILLILFGFLQYYVVEKKTQSSKNVYKILLGLFLISLIFIVFGKLGSGFNNRFDAENNLIQTAITYQDIRNYDLIINDEVCHKSSLREATDNKCVINNNQNTKEIFFLGDSHSRLLLKPFAKMIKTNSVTFLTGDSCIYFTNIINPDCKRSDKEELKNTVAGLQNKIIIYVADLQDKLGNSKLDVLNNVPISIKELSRDNYVIVIMQIPPFPVNVGNRILSNTDLYEVKYFSNEWSEKANKITLDRMYQSLKSEKIYFVDTYNIFCEQIQKGYCVGADRNNIYIYDDNHPSDVGGKLIIQEIKEIINKLNKK